MVMMFCVSVPVLSEHNVSIPASSSDCQSRRESDEHGHTTYGSGHKMVQIAVRWSRGLQSAETNVVQSFAVQQHALERALT